MGLSRAPGHLRDRQEHCIIEHRTHEVKLELPPRAVAGRTPAGLPHVAARYNSPCRRRAKAKTTNPFRSSAHGDEFRMSTGQWRILIVDSDRERRDGYERFLRQAPHCPWHVTTADPEEARPEFEQGPLPDCVVLGREQLEKNYLALRAGRPPGPREITLVVLVDRPDEARTAVAPQGDVGDWLIRSEVTAMRLQQAVAHALEKLELRRELAKCQHAVQLSHRETEMLASAVSHDLGGPVGQITGFCQLLAKRSSQQLGPEGHEFLGFIEKSADRLHELVGQLASYLRLAKRHSPREPADCAVVFKSVLSDLGAEIARCNAKVTMGTLPTISGNRTQLAQLMRNLIDNALKFRSERSPIVEVVCQQFPTHWQFSVRDNGLGIDPKQAENIFHIFRRLHTQEEYPGTGVGLAACRKIVQLHGGHIWVQSVPGEGSTFYFTMPISDS